ncbi:hypothetical protein K4S71_09770 [Staphylococcus epidermidis]|nr:hypothetical protein [Staphylococcus epidermidis]MCG1591650.1 hypothetical protein [Staphylococcus epidermidis]MCG2478641.1 hypothetical protein [Staphylococcus epidermidis]
MFNSFFVLGLNDDQKEAIDILSKNQDLFHSNGAVDFLIHFFVDIGWFITGWLYKFVNFLEDMLDKLVTFGGLFDSEDVTKLSEKMTPIAFSLMGVIIVILAITMMFGMKIPFSKLTVNIILASLFIITIPNIFKQAYDFNTSLYKDVSSDGFIGKSDMQMTKKKGLKKLSSQIMASNITDLVWYANNNYKHASDGIDNDFTDASFINGYRRWTEKVNPGEKPDELKGDGFRYYQSISDKKKAKNKATPIVFKNSIVQAEKDSKDAYKEFELKELSDGFGASFLKNSTEAFSGFYQRYQANFFAIWFELAVLGFVLVCSALKIARIGWEVSAQKIMAPWVAATDLATLQKVKQLMINLFTNYGLIALIFVLLKVFIILSNTTFQSKLPLSVKLVIFLALALGTIDGPDEIKKILGIDAGIKDGYRSAMAGMAGLAMLNKGGGKVAHATGMDKVGDGISKRATAVGSHLGNQLSKNTKELGSALNVPKAVRQKKAREIDDELFKGSEEEKKNKNGNQTSSEMQSDVLKKQEDSKAEGKSSEKEIKKNQNNNNANGENQIRENKENRGDNKEEGKVDNKEEKTTNENNPDNSSNDTTKVENKEDNDILDNVNKDEVHADGDINHGLDENPENNSPDNKPSEENGNEQSQIDNKEEDKDSKKDSKTNHNDKDQNISKVDNDEDKEKSNNNKNAKSLDNDNKDVETLRGDIQELKDKVNSHSNDDKQTNSGAVGNQINSPAGYKMGSSSQIDDLSSSADSFDSINDLKATSNHSRKTAKDSASNRARTKFLIDRSKGGKNH